MRDTNTIKNKENNKPIEQQDKVTLKTTVLNHFEKMTPKTVILYLFELASFILVLVQFIIMSVKLGKFRSADWQLNPIDNNSTWILPQHTIANRDDEFGGCFSTKERNLESDRIWPCILISLHALSIFGGFILKIYKKKHKSSLKEGTKIIIWLASAGLSLFSGFLTINMMWIVDLNISYCYGYKEHSVYSEYFKQHFSTIYEWFHIRWSTIGSFSGSLFLLTYILSLKKKKDENGNIVKDERGNEQETFSKNAGIYFLLAGTLSLFFLFFFNVLLFFIVTILGKWTVIATFEATKDAIELIVIVIEAYETHGTYLLCLPSIIRYLKKIFRARNNTRAQNNTHAQNNNNV